MIQTLSDAGAAFIKQEEGSSLTPYEDPEGSGTYSIGHGHHFAPGEPVPNLIREAEQEVYFEQDVAKCQAAIYRLVRVSLSQGQFDALVDFIYNEGVGHFETSTLLKLLNAGHADAAGLEFKKWDLASGSVNEALVSRRAGELQLWIA